MTTSQTYATPYNRTENGISLTVVSLYDDAPFNSKDCFKELATITELFGLSKEFVFILVEALKLNNFTNQRFRDAVSKVVCSFRFQKPTVADFVAFDDFIKLYPWNVKNRLVQNGTPNEDFFKAGLIGNLVHYVRVSEVEALPECKKQIVRNFVRTLRNKTLNK